MEDEINQATVELGNVLGKIKSEIDSLRERIVDQSADRDQISAHYKSNVLPHLLQLRLLNRVSKDKLEYKHERVKKLSRELDNLHDTWENLAFEGSCLGYDVDEAKRRLSPTKLKNYQSNGVPDQFKPNGVDSTNSNYFDIEKIASLDHRERLDLLDQEEAKRKALQDRLANISADTSKIELICEASGSDIDRLKPIIRQLVDKVEPLHGTSSQTTQNTTQAG